VDVSKKDTFCIDDRSPEAFAIGVLEIGLRPRTRARKSVIAEQIAAAMKERGLTKTRMAEIMQTSRAQLDRLLDPSHGGVTLETLMSAAKAVGRELRLELV
jgi:hypothetical protein